MTDSGQGVSDSDDSRASLEVLSRGVFGQRASAPVCGLAITREIVRTHEGTLQVEDVLPNGARFVLVIPTTDQEIE